MGSSRFSICIPKSPIRPLPCPDDHEGVSNISSNVCTESQVHVTGPLHHCCVPSRCDGIVSPPVRWRPSLEKGQIVAAITPPWSLEWEEAERQTPRPGAAPCSAAPLSHMQMQTARGLSSTFSPSPPPPSSLNHCSLHPPQSSSSAFSTFQP